MLPVRRTSLFFFTDTPTTEIYTLSLHDALPISSRKGTGRSRTCSDSRTSGGDASATLRSMPARSEEHTSELQSRLHLVCRLLLEKKNNADRDIIDLGRRAGADGVSTERAARQGE